MGRDIRALVTKEGDELITVQTAKKEGEKSTKSTRKFFDDKCVLTIEIIGTDTVCTQTFTESKNYCFFVKRLQISHILLFKTYMTKKYPDDELYQLSSCNVTKIPLLDMWNICL